MSKKLEKLIEINQLLNEEIKKIETYIFIENIDDRLINNNINDTFNDLNKK